MILRSAHNSLTSEKKKKNEEKALLSEFLNVHSVANVCSKGEQYGGIKEIGSKTEYQVKGSTTNYGLV